MRMKMQPMKNAKLGQQVIGSRDSVSRFKELASSFTKKAASSKKEAMAVLKREGIVTAKGNLTKRYSPK